MAFWWVVTLLCTAVVVAFAIAYDYFKEGDRASISKTRKDRGNRRGSVDSLWTCEKTSRPMVEKQELECVKGVGVKDDRYALDVVQGRYSGRPEPGRQLTIVTTAGLARGGISAAKCRRNVVCRGTELHARKLVGRQIAIGDEVVVFVHRPMRCSAVLRSHTHLTSAVARNEPGTHTATKFANIPTSPTDALGRRVVARRRAAQVYLETNQPTNQLTNHPT